MASLIGQTVSHYTILEHLGSGGMGVVYKAQDLKLDRPVALKFLPPELTRDPETKQRFVHEAKVASALDHQNICNVHDIGETDDGQIFLVMAFYEGETLKKKIERGPLKIQEAIAITIQIAYGLAKAHEHGIVHRDIKPANIMLTKDSVAKIVDFGLAKLSGPTMITKTGSTLGTAAYMAPEQARGEPTDQRTDIWALGVVLYEMLTGKRPFESDYEQGITYRILNEEPIPAASLRNNLPDAIESVITKALQKDQRGRYQHVAEMLPDLISISEQMDASAPEPRSPSVTHHPSIVVLPFTNTSADQENEYFSDGITEEIINSLTRVTGLFVASRTSSFAFKGTTEDVREIARKLNVGNVLEGSVRKTGNRLRITTQLVKAVDGFHIWSDRFDRELADIFAIQDDIALSIVDALKVKLLGEEKKALAKRSTQNLEAYTAFLKGRHFLNTGTSESIRKAINEFEEALSLEPDYAQACAELANAYFFLAFMDLCPPQAVYPKAKAYATKAIEIDPTLPEALGVVATVKGSFEWDWAGAEAALEEAIALSPNDAGIRVKYAYHHMWLGRMDQACVEISKAICLDPLINPAIVGLVFIRAGRYKEAREQFQVSIISEPDRAHSHWFMGHLDVLEGHYERGISLIRKAATASGNSAMILAGLGWSCAVAGEKGQAYAVLEELHTRAKDQYVRPYLFAKIYSGLGESDLAFEWLDRACGDHDMSLVHVLNDETLQNLHGDPRFLQVLRKVGLAQ